MNKKRSIALTFAVLACIALSLYLPKLFQAEITNQDSKNTGIIAFGDSLVYGAGSTRGGGFVKMLSEELGISITNLGVSGDTTKNAVERVVEVVRRKPAIVIMLFGGNDFLTGIAQEETKRNLEKTIQAIHASGAAVILVGLESEIIGREHKELFESLAATYRTAYVPDILDGIFGNRELMSDALHPNDAGYRLMAERIKPALKDLLN